MKRVALLAVLVSLGLSVTVGNLVAGVTLTTLHIFHNTDGNAPDAGLALGTNGNFYGTTQFGGVETNGCVGSCGTLFEISPGGGFMSLHLFNYDDGSAPRGGLVQASDGNLYGTTFDGGACGLGTAFRITASGTLTTVSPPDPGSCCAIGSNAGLVQTTDGDLYGTGGAGVFQIATNGVCTSLNVALPQSTAAGLIQGSDGNLYGTTQFGGTSTNCGSGCGTVFQLTTSGELTVLHSFDGSDGKEPVAGLVQDSNGILYGTTSGGLLTPDCTEGCGTVFQITTNGVFTPLHAFAGTEGRQPRAGLVQGSDGNFYGTTFYGGANGVGTVFQITTNGVLTRLFSFGGTATAGANPAAGLIEDGDGIFYGTTQSGGGTNGFGTVFKLTVSTNSSATTSCVLSPALATNTVGASHTVVATVTSNGVASSGARVNFSVIAGPNIGHAGTATTSGAGEGSFTYTGGVTPGTDTIRAISLAATGTATKVWIAAVANHDLTVIKMKAPKKITLSAKKPNVTGKFTVSIENQGDATEVIPDVAALANLVTLSVQSLGACTNPVATLVTPKFAFPLNLAPKKKLNLAYTAIFSCANDPLATSKTAAHNDYRVLAAVDLSALGEVDATSANDDCPRPPSGSDAGCGNKNPDGTLGADVLIDVVAK